MFWRISDGTRARRRPHIHAERKARRRRTWSGASRALENELRRGADVQWTRAAANALPGRSRTSRGAARAYRCGASLPRTPTRSDWSAFTPDDIDWDDETRIAIEERAAFSSDALSGWKRRCASPDPKRSNRKYFARLSAWQNWIFQRPNAIGEKGALKLYGTGAAPEFDPRRVIETDGDRLFRADSQQRQPGRRSPPAARARSMAAGVPEMVARDGAGGLSGLRGLPAHRDFGRRERMGDLRLRQDARIRWGIFLAGARLRRTYRLRRT